MLSFDDALGQLLKQVDPLTDTETVSLSAARWRLAASAVRAPIDVPPFENSAMDGYAVHHADPAFTDGPPAHLRCIGTALAGHPFPGSLGAGECVRIFTGAPMPAGADAVLLQEDAVPHEDQVRFDELPRQRRWVRPVGNDFAAGTELVNRGAPLTPFHLGLLASAGITTVAVVRRPRVAVLSNGDELIEAPAPLAPGQIYSSNATVIAALLGDCGVDIVMNALVPDDPEVIDRQLRHAATTADLVISSGGVSVGDADHMGAALDRLGETAFWKVAMRPGKPLLFGRIGRALYVGLPGNPASSAVTFLTLVQPLVERLQGGLPRPAIWLHGELTSRIVRDTTRLDFIRAVAVGTADGYQVAPAGDQNSGRLQSLAQANCLLVIDGPERTINAGERVRFRLLPGGALG